MEDKRLNLPLNPLRAFAVAVRHKTFTAAAKEMGVSQVAISRQIAILENYLNLQLFERRNRSAKLTEVGRSFGFELAAIFDELERTTQRLLSHESEKTIHLRVYPSVAHYWLLPRLANFTAQFPDLRVRIDTVVAPLDFRGTHLDVAIQLGTGGWRDAKSRKLFDEEVDVVCSADYLAQLPRLESPEDVNSAQLLHSRYRRRAWEDWSDTVGIEINHREGMEFDSSLLTYSAAQQGFGLAIGQVQLLEREFQSGRLLRPLNCPIPTGASFHVVWPTTISVSTKARHFIDWLLEQAGEQPEFFRRSKSS